ncbi:hypothetical protein VNO78_22256 [Psophocarpus tetragonolobus]|uniref:Uncharacterized protein n=1 Tax=Psophocarpus tetragonolobus TaxID=3891 RepID=A0AAN9SGP6_PSOTE
MGHANTEIIYPLIPYDISSLLSKSEFLTSQHTPLNFIPAQLSFESVFCLSNPCKHYEEAGSCYLVWNIGVANISVVFSDFGPSCLMKQDFCCDKFHR